MKARIVLVFLGLFSAWSLIIFRGALLQIFPDDRLQSLKQKQFQKKVRMPGRRGVILDRNGHELAITVTSYSLFADPKLVKNPRQLSRRLSRKLKISQKKLRRKLAKKERRFTWVKRRLDKSLRDEILQWNERGLGFVEETKRVYPNGRLLAHVLGFVNSEGKGLEGIERQFNNTLSGVDSVVAVRRDARGRPLVVDTEILTAKRDGQDLVLTIDRDLQFRLEEELKKTVVDNEAESAVGVIVDVPTGEVLAMANFPTYDPNTPGKFDASHRRNRSVTDAFEPGSTMKTVLMAAALRENVVTPGKKYFCENGKFQIGRRVIGEADRKHHFGWLSVSEILAHSSNIGTSKIALDLGSQKYFRALKDFGFGAKSGAGFTGESKGIINTPPWSDHLLANVSFGHGIATTPLQMVSAYAAIARGGVWVEPQIVSQEEKISRRVLSSEEAAQLVLMLSGVTGTAGTVKNAHIPGFPVAGKTGTAQKVKRNGKGYERGAYISSFAGFVPTHNPKYAIYIAVDNPKKQYYGSQVAAPVFSAVGGYAVRHAGLSPVLISEENVLPKLGSTTGLQKRAIEKLNTMPKVSEDGILMPDLRGLTLREVFRRTRDSKIPIRVKGNGVVLKTFPGAGERVPDRGIRVYLGMESQ